MILTGWQEFSIKDGQSLQQMVFKKLDIHMQKNDIGHLLYTTNENKLKFYQSLKCKT